jgi:hypothetical protein
MCRQQEEGEVLLQRKKSRPDIENLYVKNTLVQNFRHKTVTQSKDIKETYFLQCLDKSSAQTRKKQQKQKLRMTTKRAGTHWVRWRWQQ